MVTLSRADFFKLLLAAIFGPYWSKVLRWWRGRYGLQITDFHKLSIPLLRQVFPQLVANQICEVQPMLGPVGEVFSMASRYGFRYTYANHPIRDDYYNRQWIRVPLKKQKDCIEFVRVEAQ